MPPSELPVILVVYVHTERGFVNSNKILHSPSCIHDLSHVYVRILYSENSLVDHFQSAHFQSSTLRTSKALPQAQAQAQARIPVSDTVVDSISLSLSLSLCPKFQL